MHSVSIALFAHCNTCGVLFPSRLRVELIAAVNPGCDCGDLRIEVSRLHSPVLAFCFSAILFIGFEELVPFYAGEFEYAEECTRL